MQNDNKFSSWPFTDAECIQLLVSTSVTNELSTFPASQLSFSIETLAKQYLQENTINDNLLIEICSTIDKIPQRLLLQVVTEDFQNTLLIASLLKVTLPFPFDEEHMKRCNKLFTAISKSINADLFEAHLMYYLSIGFRNRLDDWNIRFDVLRKQHKLSDHNQALLKIALTILDNDLDPNGVLNIDRQDSQSTYINAFDNINWLAFMSNKVSIRAK
jgi:hypothetical protein